MAKFRVLQQEVNKRNSLEPLPEMPGDLIKWCMTKRKIVEGKKRTFFLPMWQAIYEDHHPFIMIVGGRQIFKSTYFGDKLGHLATTKRGSTGIYVTHDDESLSAFSNDKYRIAVLEDNPDIFRYVKGSKLGQIHRVAYRIGSKTYLVTDERGFKHVEGKSPDLLILDEGQYLEFEHWTKVRESMATTQGKVIIGGIGGEQGSEYHNFWETTNQCEWVFKNPNWRDNLEFNKDGLVWGEYLLDVLDGKWVAKNPEAFNRHGYHLPQTIFPHIPWSEFDAVEKYKTDREYSIEYKQNNYPQTQLLNHVFGLFYQGQKRPLTEAMVRACMKPYGYLDLLQPNEVRELKATFGHDILVLMGVDYGSGNVGSSKTIASIWIKWKARPERGFFVPRYQLVWIREDFPADDDDKAEELAWAHKAYDVDFGVGDMGYGAHINKKIKEGGRNRTTGEPWEGVKRKFKGCWTRKAVEQMIADNQKETDEKGTKEGFILIDKTQSIDLFIDTVKRYSNHPEPAIAEIHWPDGATRTNNSILEWSRPQLMIPYLVQRKTDWLVKDWTKIERKDIEDEDIQKPDKRQQAHKEYNHPPDSVMSTIYMLTADANFDEGAYRIMGVRNRR